MVRRREPRAANPSGKPQKYTVKLDRAFGLVPGSGPFYLKSPLDGSWRGLPKVCNVGDSQTFELCSLEIRIIHFGTNRHPEVK